MPSIAMDMDYILPTLVLIAQAVIPLESGQMQLNAVCRRDWISIHIGPTRLISTKKICGNPTEYLYPHNPKILHTHTPHPVFLLDAFLNKHIYAVHVTMLLCVFSNDNEEKNCSERNYKLDCIWRNSNSDCDICRVFNAFPLISRV